MRSHRYGGRNERDRYIMVEPICILHCFIAFTLNIDHCVTFFPLSVFFGGIRYSNYRSYSERSPPRRYRSPPRGRTPPRFIFVPFNLAGSFFEIAHPVAVFLSTGPPRKKFLLSLSGEVRVAYP